jgi:hypothetical protein
MEILIPLVLLAGLFLVADLLSSRPSWLRALGAAAARQGREAHDRSQPVTSHERWPQDTDDLVLDLTSPAATRAEAAVVEWDVFALPFLRHRLHVVADELERLDHDPTVFARAFRTVVARSAYEALLADVSRLTAVPTLELQPAGPPAARREELEL